MSRVLLVTPTFHYADAYPTFLSFSDFPTGFGYITSVLKQAGHEVYGCNPNNIIGYPNAYLMIQDVISKKIGEVKPDLIGLGGLCTDYAFLKDAIGVIRRVTKTPIVLGGQIVTNDAEDVFNLLKPDYAVVGEGEYPMLTICNGLSQPGIVRTSVPTDLSFLPFPDYEPFGIQDMIDNYSDFTRILYKYTRPYPRPFSIVASRSCPFTCLPAGEQVLMADGTQKDIATIEPGDHIVSVDNDGRCSISCVSTTKLTRHPLNDIIALKTSNGAIRCTTNHRLLGISGWEDADNFRVGDWIGKAATVRRRERSTSPQDDSKQSHETPRSQGEGQSCNQISACHSERTYETELARWQNFATRYVSGRTASNQRTYEAQEPNAQCQSETKGDDYTSMAQLLRPQSLSRTLVQEEDWPKLGREKIGRCLDSIGFSFCGGWQVLDRPMSEWEMPESRLYLEEWAEQNSSSLQLELLAQFTELRRYSDRAGLQESRLADIYHHRRYAEGFRQNHNSNQDMVEWVQITEINQAISEPVYDIETLPHHNFIASGFIVHNCTFCIHGHRDIPYRARSIESIMEEIKVTYEKYHFNILILLDELFAVSKGRMNDFCDGVLQGKQQYGWDFDWMFQTHASARLDLDSLKKAKQAGCVSFSYGLESASPRVLESMEKKIKVEQVIEAIHLAKEAKLGFSANLIFGDPAETYETAAESLAFWLEYGRDACIFLAQLKPYPGSKIFQYCIEKGLIKDKKTYYENIDKSLINMTCMSNQDFNDLMALLSFLENKWLFVNTALTTSYLPESPNGKVIEKIVGGGFVQLRATCPSCGEESLYRQWRDNPDAPFMLGISCLKCQQKMKVLP